MLICTLKKIFPINSTGRWMLLGFYSNPIRFPIAFVRSLIASYKITKNIYPIKVRLGVGQIFDVVAASEIIVKIDGIIFVEGWGGIYSSSSISLSNGASLIVLGDIALGPGVHITIGKQAVLEFGGRRDTHYGCGITANSIILVQKSIRIGFGTIIAWGVVISDSDSHNKNWGTPVEPVMIGDHVWIAHDVSITKGAIIPSGCIVGAKSLVNKKFIGENLLIAGVPAIIRRDNVDWKG
jgi:acetyltransferase-like isoleucine patch superfamily enzyme